MNIGRLVRRRFLPHNAWGDREFCRRRFVRRHGRSPNPHKPERINDHLYRLKTDGSLLDPLCQFVTDKEFAKLYIAHTVGPDYLPETYRVLRNADDIEAFVPDRVPCVVKPTHLSGAVLFHTDADESVDRDLLSEWLDTERYSGSREANYRYLRPKIIVEEFLSEDGLSAPKDYKLFCFHGVPKMIQVDSGRSHRHTRNLYDPNWHRLPASWHYPPGETDDPRPEPLEGMLEVASRLSAPFSFVRVDLYAIATEVKVGELTFCPGGANEVMRPPAADIELAKLFDPDYRLDARACAEEWAAERRLIVAV